MKIVAIKINGKWYRATAVYKWHPKFRFGVLRGQTQAGIILRREQRGEDVSELTQVGPIYLSTDLHFRDSSVEKVKWFINDLLHKNNGSMQVGHMCSRLISHVMYGTDMSTTIDFILSIIYREYTVLDNVIIFYNKNYYLSSNP